MAKKIKVWNGTAMKRGEQYHVYVGAHSIKHMIELLDQAGFYRITYGEVRTYFSTHWSTRMQELVPEPEIGVWITSTRTSWKDPERVL